ncbi:SCO family protein [Aquirufa aurantiipilula]
MGKLDPITWFWKADVMGFWALKTVEIFLRKSLVISLFASLTACQSEDKVSSIPYYNSPDFSPQFLDKVEAKGRIKHHIDHFYLKDHHGKTFSQDHVKGKIHLAQFIFTRCGNICPEMISQMKIVAKKFSSNPQVEMLSYSVTPWIDDVPTLKKFAEEKKIDAPNWHLLTGSKSVIYNLARKSYFAEEELGYTKDSTEFLHTEHMILVDREGRIRGIYNGTLPLEAEQCVKDMEKLLSEN